ncbi:MAG TPA: MarR family transcriptional regulator [Streptosporangiaceae bacterium]|nr:MarR family transcriptional regulator [Streptosporangiaceae bacterium]
MEIPEERGGGVRAQVPEERGGGVRAQVPEERGGGVRVQVPEERGGLAEEELATGVAAAIERLIGLFRSLSPASGLSLTAAATLATLERSGPDRLTGLAVREGVTQPGMTQLIARLQDAGLAERAADPADGRVVQVRITADGRAMLARRRAVRASRLALLLDRLSPDERNALAAALPAMDALANAQRAVATEIGAR